MYQFNVSPGVGPLPIKFGMTPPEVAAILSAPLRITTNFLGEREEARDGVNVRYDKLSYGVVEVSIFPNSMIEFRGIDLLTHSDSLSILTAADSNPYEWVGFIVFLMLGIAVTGVHDNDRSQLAVTVFELGRWDGFRSQFKSYIP